MRDRHDIETNEHLSASQYVTLRLILEVMLDIRGLLEQRRDDEILDKINTIKNQLGGV